MMARHHFTPGMSVGLFGGSFDPPHTGHRLVSLTALKALQLDRIWWLVSPQNPLKQHAPKDTAARVAACRALARHPKIFVSDEETRLGTQYAIDTVRRLKAANPGVRFIWLMGADNLAGLHKWKFWDELMREIPVAIYPRPGQHLAGWHQPGGDALCAVAQTGQCGGKLSLRASARVDYAGRRVERAFVFRLAPSQKRPR